MPKTNPLFLWRWPIIVAVLLLLLLHQLLALFVFDKTAYIEQALLAEHRVERAIIEINKTNPTQIAPPSTQNAMAGVVAPPLPKLAVIITDLGLDHATTRAALRLPSQVSLGFSPYAPSLNQWMNESTRHELLLHLPLEVEAMEENDPGPYALLSGAEHHQQNVTRLYLLLALSDRISGFYTHADEIFTRSDYQENLPILRLMLQILNERSLALFYQQNDYSLPFPSLAKSLDAPFMLQGEYGSNVTDSVAGLLDAAHQQAQLSEYALVTLPAEPTAIAQLEAWIKEHDGQDVTMTRFSSLPVFEAHNQKKNTQ